MPDQVLIYSRFPKALMLRIGERFELLDAGGKPPNEVFGADQLAGIRAMITAGGTPLGGDMMDMMPNPKIGTVTMDVATAVKGAKGGSVEFRVEKAGIVQAGIGKASFSEEKLVQNVKALADAVAKAKPAGAKGTYIQRVAVSSTMGPGVKVEPGTLLG